MRNKFHNFIENFLSFYETFFTKGYYHFKYYPIPSSICPFVKSYLISRKSNISAFRAVPILRNCQPITFFKCPGTTETVAEKQTHIVKNLTKRKKVLQ